MTALPVQGVANSVWACGKLKHHPGPLIQAVRTDLSRRGADYSMEDWSAILLAFTDLGEDPRHLLQIVHHLVGPHSLHWKRDVAVADFPLDLFDEWQAGCLAPT